MCKLKFRTSETVIVNSDSSALRKLNRTTKRTRVRPACRQAGATEDE